MSVSLAPAWVLTIPNRHSADCSEPPGLSADHGGYTSYFEGPSGDQWVYLRDADGTETLYGGDIGWDEPRQANGVGPFGLVLDRAERAWIEACREASGASLPRRRS